MRLTVREQRKTSKNSLILVERKSHNHLFLMSFNSIRITMILDLVTKRY